MASSHSFMRRAIPAIAVLTTAGFYLGLKTRTAQEKRTRKNAVNDDDAGGQLSTGVREGRRGGFAVETHRSGGGV